MSRLVIISCVLWASAPAWAAVALTASKQGNLPPPYRAAELHLVNDSTLVARAVWLRWQEGGPAILIPVLLAGGADRTVTLPLPALSQQQTFEIRLLAGESPGAAVIARAAAEITWPPDQVTAEHFQATPEQAALTESPPFWPASILLASWLLVLLSGLVLAGLLFIRTPLPRIGLLIVASAALTLAVIEFLRSQPILIEKAAPGHVLIVAARRTTTWNSHADMVTPLYLDARQMREDDLLLRPGNVQAIIRPGEPRCFSFAK